MKLDKHYWETRYLSSDTPWNITTASPALTHYFDQLTDKNIEILIPGAGHAHEAAYLTNLGFTNVTICDISPAAIEAAKKLQSEPNNIQYIQDDFFNLTGQFDLIVEQTFFCALDPKLRLEYTKKMYELLKNGGKLIGLLFSTHFQKEGPPFGGSEAEYRELFHNMFIIKIMENCHCSIGPRKDNEIFFICQK